MAKIYVASSWRNGRHCYVVAFLRNLGHEVYDFRNPAPGNNGFGWSEIDIDWRDWSPSEFREALEHPIARDGFGHDMRALAGCDACLCVLPCGRSAHLELGFAVGAGKKTAVFIPEPSEPELMYRMLHQLVISFDEIAEWAAALEKGGRS